LLFLIVHSFVPPSIIISTVAFAFSSSTTRISISKDFTDKSTIPNICLEYSFSSLKRLLFSILLTLFEITIIPEDVSNISLDFIYCGRVPPDISKCILPDNEPLSNCVSTSNVTELIDNDTIPIPSLILISFCEIVLKEFDNTKTPASPPVILLSEIIFELLSPLDNMNIPRAVSFMILFFMLFSCI